MPFAPPECRLEPSLLERVPCKNSQVLCARPQTSVSDRLCPSPRRQRCQWLHMLRSQPGSLHRGGKVGESSWFQQCHLPAHLAVSSSVLVSSRNTPVVLGRRSGYSFMLSKDLVLIFPWAVLVCNWHFIPRVGSESKACRGPSGLPNSLLESC